MDEIDAEKHGVDPRDKLKHDIGGRERERERERAIKTKSKYCEEADSVVYRPIQVNGLIKGNDHSAYTLLQEWHPLPFAMCALFTLL